MDRLGHVIIFTGDVTGIRRFYEGAVGLTAREHSPEWVEFDTGGATLALGAMPDPAKRGVHLRFITGDIESRVRELGGRGVEIDPRGVETFGWGKLASLWDPEGNHLTLWQPSAPEARGQGPALSVVVNCRDLTKVKGYYRDGLGFPTVVDSPWWVQLSVGEAGMGLHPFVGRGAGETHHGRPITIGFGVPGLREWVDEARARGLEFTAPPTDRGFGTFADAVDPDGNPLTFRETPESETPEEHGAAPRGDPQAREEARDRGQPAGAQAGAPSQAEGWQSAAQEADGAGRLAPRHGPRRAAREAQAHARSQARARQAGDRTAAQGRAAHPRPEEAGHGERQQGKAGQAREPVAPAETGLAGPGHAVSASSRRPRRCGVPSGRAGAARRTS
jgi:predicted enzyme related to lactoylglutathione lyase